MERDSLDSNESIPEGFKKGETLSVFTLQDGSQVALVSPQYIFKLQEFVKEMAEALEDVSNIDKNICVQTYLDVVEPVLKKFKEWK